MPRANEALNDATASIKSALAVDVTSGDVTLASPTRGLYVGTSGDVAVVFVADAASVVLKNLAAGIWHPVQVVEVKQTGTAATDIVAGF